jgi:hypothetical protein
MVHIGRKLQLGALEGFADLSQSQVLAEQELNRTARVRGPDAGISKELDSLLHKRLAHSLRADLAIAKERSAVCMALR